jgi:UDP-N-acetylglucosamine 1-carboxyvinyltransferase
LELICIQKFRWWASGNGGETLASFNIVGDKPLSGELRIHGAKNAALPILAASILASGHQEIKDVPQLLDIEVMLNILQSLGIKTSHRDQTVNLDISTLHTTSIPEDLMGKMRSSIFLMGPILARFGEVTVSRPGGCAIGERPIDLHLYGLKALGAEVEEGYGKIVCRATQLIGTEIHLRYPSVGATENLMMAATLAKGKTIISNAAREPEIIDLQNFLVSMGAKIRGAGTNLIEVIGVEELQPVSYRIIPDRIIAGTIVLAAAITRGEVTLRNVIPEHISSLISLLETSGVEFTTSHDIIKVNAKKELISVEPIKTAPYPGFPTDLQAQVMAFLATVKGTTVLTETVFEGRLKHVDELQRLGATISLDLNTVFIRGTEQLRGAIVEATDLRAGAALVIAGLASIGKSTVTNIHYIDRGYQSLENMLRSLGAQIERV